MKLERLYPAVAGRRHKQGSWRKYKEGDIRGVNRKRK
jgi:hypothetical protein